MLWGRCPGSLSEGAGSPQGLTEGVSFDGCSMPAIYTPAHMNSETFERLRSSGYTPSASLRSAAPSEREPGTVGLYHSSCRSETGTLRAIFIAPTKLKRFWLLPFNGRHSLSHALWACQLPQGGSREQVSPCVVLLSGWGVRAGCIGWRLRCRVPGGGPFVPGGG